MAEQSKILLSQEEIDALVMFLTSNQKGLGGEVLDQGSVDKLIYLLKTIDGSKFKFNVNTLISSDYTLRDKVKGVLAELESKEGDRLEFKINDDTQYIELYKVSASEEERHIITPGDVESIGLDEKREDEIWGYSIAPVLFDSIANIFKIKYSKKTFDNICELYALKNFGSKEHKVPEMYLPLSTSMIKNILV